MLFISFTVKLWGIYIFYPALSFSFGTNVIFDVGLGGRLIALKVQRKQVICFPIL